MTTESENVNKFQNGTEHDIKNSFKLCSGFNTAILADPLESKGCA